MTKDKRIVNGLSKGTILHGKTYYYEIIKVLGQGSFGITYLASVKMRGELGTIDATVYVAIKEFFMHEINGRANTCVTCGSKEGIYDKYKKKFISEAKNLGKLQHENIIKVVEAFEENNTVYYSMEFLSGGSLDEYIAQKGRLAEQEALEYVSQIADALSFMHSRHMLHLDLKPSNIMLRDKHQAVLIDFGLSKQFDESGNPESSTTIGGGTPGYAPIEQANYHGDMKGGLPVTMDVYALGATMFKMLTGVRPPEASVVLNEGFPAYELQEKNISEQTVSILAKAMAATKKERFQNVSSLVSSFGNEDTSFEEKEDEEEKVSDTYPIKSESDIVDIVNQLVENEQYKEAYNLCLDCIRKNNNVAFANNKCKELIPLLKKNARSESRQQTVIITIVTIVVTILSIFLGMLK